MYDITRRSFLKSSAWGTASGWLATAVGSAADNRDQPGGKETFQLTREIPVEKGFDLVVAGGGPAGAAAAICAARLGAKVALIEATGGLGGMGTNGLVSLWFSLTDGIRSVVGGLILELIQALCRENMASPNALERSKKGLPIDSIGFQPEALKLLLDKLCADAGVEVRFFTRVVEADTDPQQRRVRGVITSSVEGLRYLRAATFIDATGDAILDDLCGAAARAAGRDTPKIMPPTLCAAVTNVDYDRFGKKSQQAMVEQAITGQGHRRGRLLTQIRNHLPVRGNSMTKPTLTLLTAYWAGKRMSGKKWEDRGSISCRPFLCRFFLSALLLAPLAARHGVELKLGDVVSNHTTALVS